MKIPISNFESEKNSWVYSEGHDRKLPKPLPCIFHIWLCNHFLLLSGSRYCHVYPPRYRLIFQGLVWGWKRETPYSYQTTFWPLQMIYRVLMISFGLYIFYLYTVYTTFTTGIPSPKQAHYEKKTGGIWSPLLWYGYIQRLSPYETLVGTRYVFKFLVPKIYRYWRIWSVGG